MKRIIGIFIAIIAIALLIVSLVIVDNFGIIKRAKILYVPETNKVSVLSTENIDEIELVFVSHTNDFGDKKEYLKVKDIKANCTKVEKFTSQYENTDVTVNSIEYIGYNKELEFFAFMGFLFSIILFAISIRLIFPYT